jgi:galactokinase
VSVNQLDNYRGVLPQVVYKRAFHVVTENQRVLTARQLLQQQKFEAFGDLLFSSHQSSQENFENSCPELDALVSIANQTDYCHGARLSGGGFGGISIHLVPSEKAAEYVHLIKEQGHHLGISESDLIVCQSADGASSIHL